MADLKPIGGSINSQDLNNNLSLLKSENLLKADKAYVDANNQALESSLSANVNALTTQIASVASGSPKGAYADLSALTAAHPTGDTSIYTVAADGKWYYWSGSAWTAGGTYQSTGLADKGVTPIKLSDYVKVDNANVFYSSLESGSFNSTGDEIGSESSLRSVDFDAVKGSADYVLVLMPISGASGTVAVVTYDSDKNYIERITRTSTHNYVAFSTGSTVRYIKSLVSSITGYTTDNAQWMLVEGTDVPTEYVAPDTTSYMYPNLKVPYLQDQIDEQQTTIETHTTQIADADSKIVSKYAAVPSVNAFYSDLETGSLSSSTGGPTASATAVRSVDFDAVEANKDYVLSLIAISDSSGTVAVATYDSDQNYIERITRTGSNLYVAFNTGDTVKYIKSLMTAISGDYTADSMQWMLVEGTDVPTEYVAPDTTSYKLEDLKVPYLQDQVDDLQDQIDEQQTQLDAIGTLPSNVFATGFKYIAYSGCAKFGPINAIETFNTAALMGYRHTKADMRITSDDVIVLSHDDTVDTMTNGTGTIRDMTLAQIKALKVDSSLSIVFDYDLRIATLDEFLLCCKLNSLVPFINLRDEYMDTIIPILIARLKYYNMYDIAVFQSFTVETLQAVRSAGVKNLCMLILNSGDDLTTDDIDTAKAIGNCGIICFNNIESITTSLIQTCRDNGVPLEYAIVEDTDAAQAAKDLGFDGILTDAVYDENRGAARRRLTLKTTDHGATWAQPSENPQVVWLTSTSTVNESDNTIDVYINEVQTNWLWLLKPKITFDVDGGLDIRSICWYDKASFKIKIKLIENGSAATLGSLTAGTVTGVLDIIF